MATEKIVLDEIKKKTTTDDTIGRFIGENQEVFPQAADISIDFGYVDPFEIPKYCNNEQYAFAWLDPQDDIAMHRALDTEHFRIVTRSSSCFSGKVKVLDRDFRSHGAIERQGMILGFRPKDLDNKLRSMAVIQHQATVESVSEGKAGEGYETSFVKYKDGDRSPAARADKAAGINVYAEEAAGTEGVKIV